jgi:serine protein kinase
MTTATAAKEVFDRIQKRSAKPELMTMTDFLLACRDNPGHYATAAERLLKAIGEPRIVHTENDGRMSRVFQNRTIKVFDAFSDFYGIEDSVESVYNFLKSAAQGLEEQRQILYFLGPVGSAKSSLAEKLKDLMEKEPIYVLCVPKVKDGQSVPGSYVMSPIYESPLGLFPKGEAAALEEAYGIPARYFTGFCSPWATKRLAEFDGDVTQFMVAKIYPSRIREIGIAKTEPGDDNNQDISSLVGKSDVRQLEEFAVDDPDAYSYSGALCKASQGLMEFVEMFKAPIKTLHPLLTATQERNFLGTESIGAMPFNGIIVAHSNEAEWDKFSKDKRNEAFLDRVKIIRVKYNLRLTEERLIYKKLLDGSALTDLPVAPHSLELLSRLVVTSRLTPSNKVKPRFKALIYDGDSVRDELPNASTLYELQEEAGANEGMTGISTRTAFKIISQAANTGEEIAIDPIEIMEMARTELIHVLGPDGAKPHLTFLKEESEGWLRTKIHAEIREALLEDFNAYGQTVFERYIEMADVWLNPEVGGYKDPDTGTMVNKEALDKRLKEIETPAGIQNNKDFRSEINGYVLRYRAGHENRMPDWKEFQKMKKVIEATINKSTSDLLPIIKFGPKRSAEEEGKHQNFVERMMKRGYTKRQVQRIVTWHEQAKAAA